MKSSPQRQASRNDAFEALYERHHREVWALAYARLLNAEAAMDVMQEAFMRLWREWDRGTAIANARAWLMRVARNLAEDHDKSAFQRNGTQSPQIMTALRSRELSPSKRLENDELFGQVRAALNELPAADREILSLRYALDYDAKRIAQVVGAPVTAVHMRLSRARQRLADRLAMHGEIPIR
jgi:RNA polymerase sigma-70 factor (ECF subfamily)